MTTRPDRDPEEPDALLAWVQRRSAKPQPEPNRASRTASITPELFVKNRGDAHLKLGEFHEAEHCYRLVLESDPIDRNALINLGFVLKELGRRPESVEIIDRALRAVPDDADAHYLRGSLHQADGKLAQAAYHFEQAVTHRPDFEFAYRDLIVSLFRTGRIRDATLWCERALERIPTSAELHFYRSNLHKHANATDAAIASARLALKLRPKLISARSSLNDLLLEASQESRTSDGENADSDRSPQLQREIAAGYADLGLAYLTASEFVASQGAFESAVALAPQVSEYHYNLGTVCRYLQSAEAAVKSFDTAIALDTDDARPRWAKSLVYARPFPESSEAAERARVEIVAGLEKFSRWSDGRDLRGEQFVGANSPFYLTYQEHDNRPVFERYGALCAQAMERVLGGKPAAFPCDASRTTARIRIGIVSADVREHSVWFALIKGWIEHLDRRRFEIGIFSLAVTPDRETVWAELHADFFLSGPKSLQQWGDSISALNPNVLIYPAIGMDMMTLQLASLRLAPTQINTWGHPETSGLPTIDLYLSGEDFEPVNAQRFYTEKLIPLAHLGNYYHGRVQQIVEPDLRALGIDPSRPILICSGTAFKYQVEHDRVLARIAREVDGSQLIFFRQRPESLSDLLKARLQQVFLQEGLDFARHVHFIPAQPLAAFHGLLARAHVSLDTIGFSGYSTAIQAIELGLPLITREGRYLRGRLASGILRRLGMTELIAQTTDEYISLCGKLIADPQFHGRMRSELIQRRSLLYRDLAPIRHLENVIESRLKR